MSVTGEELERRRLFDETGLDSPLLREELFLAEAEPDWDVRHAALAAESPLLFHSISSEYESAGEPERDLGFSDAEGDELAVESEADVGEEARLETARWPSPRQVVGPFDLSEQETSDEGKPTAERVRFTQRVLNAIARENLTVDGILGPRTRGALQRFRQRLNLGAGGDLDPSTELALAQRALEEMVQQSLFARFGTHDAETERALIDFKRAQGLDASAELDAGTRTALADALERRARPSPRTPGAGTETNKDWAQVPVDQRLAYVMKLFVARYGYPVNCAAGIVGNLYAESGVLPNRIEGSRPESPMRARNFRDVVTDFTADQVMNRIGGKAGPKKLGVGLAQWTSGSRRTGLFRHSFEGNVLGAEILQNMDAQIDYLVSELKSKYRRVEAVLRNPGTSVEAASDEVVYNFEIPGSILSEPGPDRKRKKLPRDHSKVQAVFQARRRYSRKAFNAYQSSQQEAEEFDWEAEGTDEYELEAIESDEGFAPDLPEQFGGEEQGQLEVGEGSEEASSLEDRELDPDLLTLSEKIFAEKGSAFESEAPAKWTTCFSPTDLAKVQKAFEDNASAAAANEGDRCSCIVMLNVALGQLLPLRLKQNPANSKSQRRVSMGNLTTRAIEQAMQQLRRQGFASAPTLVDFYDRRGHTAGTLRPERMKTSLRSKVLESASQESCWFAFGLSVLDGYHSVLLLVDRTTQDARIWWLDQFSNGLDRDVTDSLDDLVTERTQAWWQHAKEKKNGKGYRTTIRLWPLQRPAKAG